MSASEEFVNYVTDTVSLVGIIQVSRVFGGTSLKVEGKKLVHSAQEVLKQYQDHGTNQPTTY